MPWDVTSALIVVILRILLGKPNFRSLTLFLRPDVPVTLPDNLTSRDEEVSSFARPKTLLSSGAGVVEGFSAESST
jgi:hypothetical protein